MNIFLIYAATTCLSNAFGLALLNFHDQSLSREMREKGYAKVEQGTMYKTKEGFKNFCLFFIPFVFAFKGIQCIQQPNMDTIKIKEKNGEIYKISELKELKEEIVEVKDDYSLYMPKKIYEIPNKYKANPIKTIYENDSKLSSMEEIIISHNDELNINPFAEPERIIKKEEKEIDIIPYIINMDSKKLEIMKSSIEELIKMKKVKEKELSLSNKDVA